MMAENTPTTRPRLAVNAFRPDPTKWIQTSTTKKSIQRPLVAFKNTFATPPSTLRRQDITKLNAKSSSTNIAAGIGSSSGKRALTEREDRGKRFRVLEDRQGTLSGFLTPPKTDSSKKSKTRKVDTRAGVRPRRPEHGAREGGQKPPQEERHIRDHNKDRSEVKKVDRGNDVYMLPPASQIRDPPVKVTPRIKATEPRHHSSPHQAPSSDIPITPVPSDVLELHKKLCGQDTGYLNRM
ncbi:hypothetical protein TREMEDRAFT_71323, partial [Tremella mesenterica DSM 1558]|uniref:uncharacterized protein n=1 Tax=Tremella mesenterica (strain ATCC 24925 / CBS 8224 / DSM 1558 / NBRC 9311 / NRRL Y-6157 / RJB 2259-6 / UBC 559-6) TaxID=578456 RepID=UPI0003F48F9E